MKLTPHLTPEERSELINRDLATLADAQTWMKQMKEAGLDFPVEHGSSELAYTFGPDEVQEVRNQFARVDQLYHGNGYQALIDGGWEMDASDRDDRDESISKAADALIAAPKRSILSAVFADHLDARFRQIEAVSDPDEQANSRRPLANQTREVFKALNAAGWKTVSSWSQADGSASLLRGPDGSAFEVTVRPAAAAQHPGIKQDTGAGSGWGRSRYQANKPTARRPNLP